MAAGITPSASAVVQSAHSSVTSEHVAQAEKKAAVAPKDTLAPAKDAPAASCCSFWETSVGKFLDSAWTTVKGWAQAAWDGITKCCSCFSKAPTAKVEDVKEPLSESVEVKDA